MHNPHDPLVFTINLKSLDSKYEFQIVLSCYVVVEMHLENIFFKENPLSTQIHNDNIALTQTFAPPPCCNNWW